MKHKVWFIETVSLINLRKSIYVKQTKSNMFSLHNNPFFITIILSIKNYLQH